MEATRQPRLLDQVCERCRVKRYSLRTEQAYTHWIRRFILFHDKRHPRTMGAAEAEAFLTYLAVEGKVAAATQNQALAAILFLYRDVLAMEQPWLDGVTRAKRPARLPVVLSRAEVRALLARLDGVHWLLASLMYGSGLRLMEAVRLRIKDVDLDRREITVSEGKGAKDRRTLLPASLVDPLRRQRERVRTIHGRDRADDLAPVLLPCALERKYPNAGASWHGSFCFPPRTRAPIPAPGSGADITCTPRRCSGRSAPRCERVGFSSRRRVTPCATRSPRICWSRDTTSARCRSFWDIRMSPPPKSTRTC